MATSKNFELGSFANNIDHDPTNGDTTIANNVILAGELRGPSTLILDPAGIGDNTGTVQIKGNLQVDGTQTTINSTTLDIDDINITLAKGAANALAANGAGITIDGANATFTYDNANDRWTMNKPLSANIVGMSIDQLTDVDTTTTAPTNGQTIIWNGTNFVPGASFSQADFNTAFASKTTTNLVEGTNLYYTNAKVDTHLASGNVQDIVVRDISARNIETSGNFTVNGTFTSVNQATLSVSDSKIFLAVGNVGDVLDVGTIYNYNDGANRTAGIFRDASDGKFNFYTNYTPAVGTTLDKTHASYTAGTIAAYEFEGRIDWDNIYDKDDVIFNSIEVGNLTVTGTQTINNAVTVSTENPLILLNNNPSLNVDTGLIGKYKESGVTRSSGVFRDASDGKFKFFTNSTQAFTDSSIINPSATGFTLAIVQASEFIGALAWTSITGKPNIPSTLGDLTNVDTNTNPPTNGQALVYSTANAEWAPASVGGGGGGLFALLSL